MMSTTIELEEKYAIPFFKKIPISIESGKGVYVKDENGVEYLDFTSGWGVTCLGYSHPVIIDAIETQSKKIIHNPCSGLTYSPYRAALLELLVGVLPENLTRVFFSNSGAESNDAAIKLARKVTGRLDVLSFEKSFHGRTISTASATGQQKHREKFNPLMPNYRFIPFNDLEALNAEMDDSLAAVIMEPIQGEGGVNIPDPEFMKQLSDLCEKNGTLLIMDEVQTGFCRTGKMFAIEDFDITVDFLTMAKGIAGGFPFGAFAVSDRVASQIEFGDHGGTYCGNPLGCAVSHAVITYLKDHDMAVQVNQKGAYLLEKLTDLQAVYPELITSVRGKGLLVAVVLSDDSVATLFYEQALAKQLFINITQGAILRLFPALTISMEELEQGVSLISSIFEAVRNTKVVV